MTTVLSSVHRRLAGISLIAFVALLCAQDAIDPTDGIGNTERVAVAASSSDRLFAATTLLFLSSVFMIPSIAVVVALVRGRGKWLAWIGAGFGVLGALGHVAVATYYAVLSALPAGNEAEMNALLDRLDSNAAAGILIVPAIAGFALGVFLLGFALARSRVLPLWAAAVTGLALVIEIVHVQPWPQMHLAQTIAMIPFVWLAMRLLDPQRPSREAVPAAV